MAELNEKENAVTHVDEIDENLRSLLFNKERDFLIKNNGEKVKVEELEEKYVGLYFSAHWCPPCRDFTPVLSEIYKSLLEKGDFEVVFISADRSEKSFKEYYHTMPWLALPFSDKKARKKLQEAFQVEGIPYLVLLDKEGRVTTTEGVEIIEDYGVDGYPFTYENIFVLRLKQESLVAAQTVEPLVLLSEERDFVIGHGGRKVKLEELEGKYVGLYFSAHWSSSCGFTPVLSKIYEELLQKGDFEIVFISDDFDEKSFEEHYHTMPWLAVPFSDENTRKKLERAFGFCSPYLVVLDKEGRVLTTNGVGIIAQYGIEGYPFTAERLDELRAKEEAVRAAQTVESLLMSDERDFVLGNGGRKVPVSELVGKTVGLFFSNHFYSSFTPQLVEIYNELKKKGEAFEIVFLSKDEEKKEDFEEYYASMPWLALPFGDNTERKLADYFSVRHVSTLVILDRDGKTVKTDAVQHIRDYGIRAYPFTKERLNELEAEDKAKREALTLQSLLVSDERNFVINNRGDQVPVSDLVGKTVALFFSGRVFSTATFSTATADLIDVYHELKESEEAFEIVCISSENNKEDFEGYYKNIPWLALPFGDQAQKDIPRLLRVKEFPYLIVFGPDGEIVSEDARYAVRAYGASAYPFTDDHLQSLEEESDEDLGNQDNGEDIDAAMDENSKPAGVICDGDVCYIAET